MLLRAATLELEDAEINELVEHTEGWAAGLYLASLAARAESDAGDTRDVVSVTGADRYLADYFRSEYLARLEPDRLTFLRRSAVLESMSGPLCDAVLDRKGSALELAALEQANLFVVPLDRNRELVPLPPSLPRAAAAGARGARAGAGSGAQPARGRLVRGAGRSRSRRSSTRTRPATRRAPPASSARSRCPSRRRGRVGAVESWLERFDGETLHRYPAVAVEGSRIHALRGRADQAETWLAAAERGAAREKTGGDEGLHRGPARRDVRRRPGADAHTLEVRARRARARAPVAPLGAGRERHRAPAARRPGSGRPRLRRGRGGLGPAARVTPSR